MSHERTVKMLTNLGLSLAEVEIYLLLTKTGTLAASNIADKLKINRQQLYPSLAKLRNRGCITTIPEQSARYSAVPIENIIDSFVKTDIEEAQILERNRGRILACWKDLMKKRGRLNRSNLA